MTAYASPVDVAVYGEYRFAPPPDDARPLYRFTDRVTADGSSGYLAEPGRYHLYVGWFCPWSQRSTIQRRANGLESVVSVSYVDDTRDGRGWAFRELHGHDAVNGFTLLQQAYQATEAGYDGLISVPVLWDRALGRIVSTDYAAIEIDLATQFSRWSDGADTYPAGLREDIAGLDDWLGPAVNRGITVADPESRARLLTTLTELDDRLAGRRYLLGDRLTVADIRLWVSLVRYGADLTEYPHLWTYARRLYREPAFRGTTRFASFTPVGAALPDWDATGDTTIVD